MDWANPSPALAQPALGQKFLYSGWAQTFYLGLFTRWAGPGLSGREPKPGPDIKKYIYY